LEQSLDGVKVCGRLFRYLAIIRTAIREPKAFRPAMLDFLI
jgi:hypothetical protein